jgi:radical SAM-linked protein
MRGDVGFPVRLRFTEHGKVRFISHRDVARAFERAFRIEQLPIAFTQGFSPRPKVSFGLALSVGHESDAEYLDVELAEAVNPAALIEPLTNALPDGIAVAGAAALADRAPALQEAVTALEWRLEVTTSSGEPPAPLALARIAAETMKAPSLPVMRTRKGKAAEEDIRPMIRRLEPVEAGEGGACLVAELSTRPASVRPAELLDAIGGGLVEHRTRRTHQWIERGGVRLEPLDADPRSAVEARAS